MLLHAPLKFSISRTNAIIQFCGRRGNVLIEVCGCAAMEHLNVEQLIIQDKTSSDQAQVQSVASSRVFLKHETFCIDRLETLFFS